MIAGPLATTAGLPATTTEPPTTTAGLPAMIAGPLATTAGLPTTTAGLPATTTGLPAMTALTPTLLRLLKGEEPRARSNGIPFGDVDARGLSYPTSAVKGR